MNCVVVGGGGFIGSHLTEELLLQECQVTVFDRPQAPYLDELNGNGAKVLLGDFLNPDDLKEAFVNAETVFHLASTTVPKSSIDDPVLDIETNLIGTINLLRLARDSGVKKIVFSSSGGTVYGIPKEIPIKESHSTDPISSYGISKLCIEKYLQLYQYMYGMDYCVLRVSNAYGERQPWTGSQGVISHFLKKAIQHEALEIWGDGTQIRDYIYAKDIVDAMIKAAFHCGDPRIYNIGTGQGHSLRDIVQIVEEVTQTRLETQYQPGRKFDVPVNILDISLAKDHLQWLPSTDLREGILRTYRWMSKNLIC